MSTEIVRERKNLMGVVRPQTVTLPIVFILTMIHAINFNPTFQREICWTENTMNGLIGSIMDNALVPSMVLYKYQMGVDAESANFKYEAVDGKHRLNVIAAFASSKYIYLPGKKKGIIVRWVYTDPRTRVCQNVFHHETENTIEWSRENGKEAFYLSAKDRQDFDDFNIDIRMIEVPLPYEQRREIFDRLQNGEKNRGSDYLKNKVYCPIINYTSQCDYENKMKDIFFERCTKKAYKFRTNWIVRLFLFFVESKKPYNSVDELIMNSPNVLVLGDSEIKKMIEVNHDRLDVTHQQFDEFHVVASRYFAFIKSQKYPLNPTQMFALFFHFCYNSNFEENLSTHMKAFSKSGMTSEFKSMWEAKRDTNRSQRRHYFMTCLTELLRMSTVVATPDEIPITKKLKKTVWANHFGKNKVRTCGCGENICFEDHHCGHIIARALNGPTVLENLRPVCRSCNLQMGTMNMDDFFADKFGKPATV